MTNVHNKTIQNKSLRMLPSGDWLWVNTVKAKIQNSQNSKFNSQNLKFVPLPEI